MEARTERSAQDETDLFFRFDSGAFAGLPARLRRTGGRYRTRRDSSLRRPDSPGVLRSGNARRPGADAACVPDPERGVAAGEISREEALAIALDNADVPEGDAYNIKNETDSDNGIPIYDIEFETDYGDYDFEVAMADGRIVGADYEVDEEWLDALDVSPVTAEEATSIVAGKVSGASAADVSVWEESGDGRGRYEGELFLDGMKYEFELDPRTGRIFDWTADLRD